MLIFNSNIMIMNHLTKTMRKKKKILYIYPDFPISAKKGAEQLDLLAGIEILRKTKKSEIFILPVNLKEKKIKTRIKPSNNRKFLSRAYSYLNYFFIKYTTLDNAMRQAFSFSNYQIVQDIIKSKGIDLIITNTTSTVLFGINNEVKHFFRSVSYEPVYVLGAVDSRVKAIVHSFLKYFSVYKELSADIVFAISPRDARYYTRHNKFKTMKTKIEILPLRQFCTVKAVRRIDIPTKNLNIAFLGSTYNVLHNKKSFDFIANHLVKNFANLDGLVINIYGSKIPKFESKYNNLVLHSWVKNTDDIYKANDVFLVPNFLPSGMQSKIFEPMFYSKVLICDFKSLSGYAFEQGRDYLHASTLIEFTKEILWVKNNFSAAQEIGMSGYRKAMQIIGPKIIQNQTQIIYDEI